MTVTIQIHGCEDCPHKTDERAHTGDSFEYVESWKCQEANNREIRWMDWNEKHCPIPKWCPLRND